jgi:hypothetical protein
LAKDFVRRSTFRTALDISILWSIMRESAFVTWNNLHFIGELQCFCRVFCSMHSLASLLYFSQQIVCHKMISLELISALFTTGSYLFSLGFRLPLEHHVDFSWSL